MLKQIHTQCQFFFRLPVFYDQDIKWMEIFKEKIVFLGKSKNMMTQSSVRNSRETNTILLKNLHLPEKMQQPLMEATKNLQNLFTDKILKYVICPNSIVSYGKQTEIIDADCLKTTTTFPCPLEILEGMKSIGQNIPNNSMTYIGHKKKPDALSAHEWIEMKEREDALKALCNIDFLIGTMIRKNKTLVFQSNQGIALIRLEDS